MKQYQDYLLRVLANGVKQSNRTGIDCITTPGEMMKFDLSEGFPAVTTKKLAFKTVVAELIGFIRGYDNAHDFRNLGCKIWDANANENKAWLNNPNRKGTDDLGRIYGVQWRDSGGVDQLTQAIHTLLTDPTNRRIIINAWNPQELNQMALPPCHVLYQFIADVNNNKLHLCMYQRSCDSFLGVPFNIASASVLLSIVAQMTSFMPGTFTHFLADAHIYENHLHAVSELLGRKPKKLPTLDVSNISDLTGYKGSTMLLDLIASTLENIEPKDIVLKNYEHHEAIPAAMAV